MPAVSGSSVIFSIPREFNTIIMAESGSSIHLACAVRFTTIMAPFSGREIELRVERSFATTMPAVSSASIFLDIFALPTDIGLLLGADVVRPVVMVDLLLDQSPVYIWTGLFDLNVKGVIYRSLSGFDTGVNVREAIGLDILSTDFRLSGLQLEFLSIALTENFQNRLANVYMAVMDNRDEFLGRELIFTGYIDNMPIQILGDRTDLLIQVGNVLARNRTAKGLRYSTEDQRCLDSTDTLFNFLPKLQANPLEWGAVEDT